MLSNKYPDSIGADQEIWEISFWHVFGQTDYRTENSLSKDLLWLCL
jgi:hypothetical protein